MDGTRSSAPFTFASQQYSCGWFVLRICHWCSGSGRSDAIIRRDEQHLPPGLLFRRYFLPQRIYITSFPWLSTLFPAGVPHWQLLVHSRLDRCDAERAPAYLEASKPDLVPYRG